MGIKKKKRHQAQLDPADGEPPKSLYPPGRTIWKFTQDSLMPGEVSERKWIEFDRETGFPAHESDDVWEEDEEMYDSDGNPINEDEDMDEDEDEDESDADMPTLQDI